MPELPPAAAENALGQPGTRVQSVSVSLGSRSYEVLVGPGLIGEAGRLIEARFGPVRCGIVTDETVARHHLASLEQAIAREALAGTAVMQAGEATKSFGELAILSERLLGMGLERGDLVLALGGGVIGDLAGFAASILRRGVRYVQIPTTLLAQVDSSVGGKTGINTSQGKNLIGAFHQPALVLADTDVLATLPARELRAGYAEVVKYGLLGDAAFFEWLERHWRGVFGNDPALLTETIQTCVGAKAGIVAVDETETGDRMLLNLGHTFGHALEAWAGFSSRLLHGEAVAIGMAQAFRLSEALSLAPTGTAARVERHLRAVGLPTRIAHVPGAGRPDVARLMELMRQDKKVRQGRLTFILVRGIGRAFVTRDVAPEAVQDFLARELALPAS